MSASLANARASVTPEARKHAKYVVEHSAEADAHGDTSQGLDVVRMKRVLPVRGLEAVVKDLSPDMIMAANHYHSDLMTAEGVGSSEIQERVDTSGDPTAQAAYLADCKMRLGRVRGRIGGTSDLTIAIESIRKRISLHGEAEGDQHTIETLNKHIARRKSRMAVIDKLFSECPHDRMTAIYGKGRPYQRAKTQAVEALKRLSFVYGFRSEGAE